MFIQKCYVGEEAYRLQNGWDSCCVWPSSPNKASITAEQENMQMFITSHIWPRLWFDYLFSNPSRIAFIKILIMLQIFGTCTVNYESLCYYLPFNFCLLMPLKAGDFLWRKPIWHMCIRHKLLTRRLCTLHLWVGAGFDTGLNYARCLSLLLKEPPPSVLG